MWNKTKDKIIYFLIAIGFLGVAYGQVVPDSPYTETLTHFEISEDKGNEGIETVKFAKDRPEMILGKWNDEVQMSVRYGKVQGTGSKNLLDDKLEWDGVNEKVVAYAIEGGYEFEIELDRRPASNVFDFQISGAENLDFFYQPIFEQEGVSRADNIKGSYAIYHKTKANYCANCGTVNYKTGKFGHIYRPKAIDADSVEVWAELNYTNGVLSVIVPQWFLDNAVYPIIIDPTFGITAEGASDQNSADRISGPVDTPASAGTTSIISAFVKESTTASAHNFKTAIYDDSDDSLVGESSELSDVGTTYTWRDFTIVESITTTAYAVVVWGSLVGGGVPQVAFDAAGGEGRHDSSEVYGAFPDPAAWSHDPTGRRYSVYATYSEGAPAVVPVDDTYFNILE